MGGSVERVRLHLESLGIDVEFRELSMSTKSSALAAQALGCTVAEIAKSVVFKGRGTVVVVISGDRRVDAVKLSQLKGGDVAVATPDEVREETGYPIGGVPPFPHRKEITVLADSSLLRFEWVWTAGGAPNAVFRIRTEDLLKAVGGTSVAVAAVPEHI
ncbi:MAG: YbaK/EbsC family protein [Nitrososphaerales archaeon]|nr:YbaK/EbsC family protein [Nitrososphaerales archaeon]